MLTFTRKKNPQNKQIFRSENLLKRGDSTFDLYAILSLLWQMRTFRFSMRIFYKIFANFRHFHLATLLHSVSKILLPPICAPPAQQLRLCCASIFYGKSVLAGIGAAAAAMTAAGSRRLRQRHSPAPNSATLRFSASAEEVEEGWARLNNLLHFLRSRQSPIIIDLSLATVGITSQTLLVSLFGRVSGCALGGGGCGGTGHTAFVCVCELR